MQQFAINETAQTVNVLSKEWHAFLSSQAGTSRACTKQEGVVVSRMHHVLKCNVGRQEKGMFAHTAVKPK